MDFTPKEEEILRIFLKNRKKYISVKYITDYINENCWKIKETSEHAVRSQISKINKKLKYSKIINKRGFGYKVVRR